MSTEHTQLDHYIPPAERIVLIARPSWISVLLRPVVSILVVTLAALGVWALFERFAGVVSRGDIDLYYDLKTLAAAAAGLGAVVVVARLVWEIAEWRGRVYALTDRRAVRLTGVIRKDFTDVPLRNIQHLTLHRSLRERLFGLGTIGIGAGGAGFYDIHWAMLRRPHEVLAALRGAADLAAPIAAIASPTAMNGTASSSANGQADTGVLSLARRTASLSRGPLVIGLVGGIGAGKSAVANEFENIGALVIDSDKQAKAALLRSEVKDQLVSWWGDGILGSSGVVDRQKIAQIVFADPAQRVRLEGLVHPIIQRRREELIKKAAKDGVAVVVIDAPLLFEAGVDRECDAVVFVDAPIEQRLDRVAVRGWDEAELTLREKAQLPLEEKRRRADDYLVNDGRREDLPARVRDLLRRIQHTIGQGGSRRARSVNV